MSFLNEKGAISYNEVRQLTDKLKQNLKDKYATLDNIVKDFNTTTVDLNQNNVGLTTTTVLEDYVTQIENLFTSGLFNGNIQINGSLIVDQIQVSDLLVKTSNNLNITKVLESSFGNQFTNTGATDVIGLIQSQDLKLKNQTLTNSVIVDSIFRNGTIENAFIKNPIGLTGATVVDTNILNSYLQSYGISNTGDTFFDIKTDTKVGTSFNKQTGVTISGKSNTDWRQDLFRLNIINTDPVLDTYYSAKTPYIDPIHPTSNKQAIVNAINTVSGTAISSIVSDVDQVLFSRKLTGVSIPGNQTYYKYRVAGYDVELLPGKADPTIQSRIYMECDQTVANSLLSINGLAFLQSGLSVSGTGTIQGQMSVSQVITGNVLSVSTTYVGGSGGVAIRNTLSVYGASYLGGLLSTSSLTVGTINNLTLDTTSASLRSALSLNGGIYGDSTLSISGVSYLHGGIVSKSTLSVTGRIVSGEALSVNGLMVSGNALSVNGLMVSSGALSVNGRMVSSVALSVPMLYSNTLSVHGTGFLNSLSITSGFHAEGIVRLQNALSVQDTVYLSDVLSVQGGIRMPFGTWDVTDGCTMTTALSVAGRMVGKSTLSIAGSTVIGGTFLSCASVMIAPTLSVYQVYAKRDQRGRTYLASDTEPFLSVSTGSYQDWYITHTQPFGEAEMALSIHSVSPYENSFPVIHLKILWDPTPNPPPPTLTSYKIYRNNTLVTTLSQPLDAYRVDILCDTNDTILF